MRVIAGSAKGTRLASVPSGTRPLSDRAREGLYSSLADRVAGARVLDLYAGTGALGIEALSRGATDALFVDRARQAASIIRDNLVRTGLSDRARVVTADVLRFLGRTPGAFDLALLDPPYATVAQDVERALELVTGWVGPEATVCLTRPRRGYMDVIPLNWHVARRLEYGDTLVVLYREV